MHGVLDAVSVGRTIAAAMAATASFVGSLPAQQVAEPLQVRQIVTFLFQPGRSGDAHAIYERQLKQIYADIPALRQFRAYREVESPEPLDLVVVSSYSGMAGMDSANAALRRPAPDGTSALALYGVLSGMTQSHHDQFVEMIPDLSDSADTSGLTVFEYLRLAPGSQDSFEALLRAQVRPLEKAQRWYGWAESGRLLVSDGWDYLRIYGISSLGAWQSYVTHAREAPYARQLGRLIAARKTIVVRNDPRLSVR